MGAVAVPLLVGAGSYGVIRIVLDLFVLPEYESPLWWPIAAAVVAVMVRCPRRWWPAVVLAFSAGELAAVDNTSSWPMAITYVIVNALEVLVASLVLTDRRNRRTRRLYVLRDALRFILAAACAVGIGAVVISMSATIFHSDGTVASVIPDYVVNHLLGYLTIAPLFLPGRVFTNRTWRSVVEFIAVILGVGVLSWWALTQVETDGRAFAMLIPVTWAAVRFDGARATAVSLLTCGIAAYATAHGRGPLALGPAASDRQLLAQTFILVVGVITIGLVLVTRHRLQLATQARDSEQTLRIAIRDALTGMYSIWLDEGRRGEIRDVNNSLCSLLGYRPEELIGRYCGMLGARGNEEEMALLRAHLDRFADGSLTSLREESRFTTASGEKRWVELHLSAVASVGEAPFILVHVHDLTEREEAKQALERMALHDPLTGLANRTLLFRRISEAIATPRGSAEGDVGLLYLDLDGFKQVNDTYGHDAGDTVLITVARRLRSTVRPDATVARLGGDEFAVLCPRVDAEELETIAERMRQALREPMHLRAGVLVSVDVSVGYGTVGPAGTADDLIRVADRAMYAVKIGRAVR